MKLKQIFTLLGVALLGLSACSKDTPKTNPASSGSLAGSQWEYIEQELEDDGKTETTTIVLRFIDGTKFVTESTSVTTQGGTILKSETDTPKQGTYTYQGKEVTLTTTRQDDGKLVTSIVRLVMDDTNQTLAGTVTDDGVRKGIIYTPQEVRSHPYIPHKTRPALLSIEEWASLFIALLREEEKGGLQLLYKISYLCKDSINH